MTGPTGPTGCSGERHKSDGVRFPFIHPMAKTKLKRDKRGRFVKTLPKKPVKKPKRDERGRFTKTPPKRPVKKPKRKPAPKPAPKPPSPQEIIRMDLELYRDRAKSLGADTRILYHEYPDGDYEGELTMGVGDIQVMLDFFIEMEAVFIYRGVGYYYQIVLRRSVDDEEDITGKIWTGQVWLGRIPTTWHGPDGANLIWRAAMNIENASVEKGTNPASSVLFRMYFSQSDTAPVTG